MHDVLIDKKLDTIIEGMHTYLLHTPDGVYGIRDNVIAPAGLTVSESGSNLVISYSDNELSAPPQLSGVVENLNTSFNSFLSFHLLLFGIGFFAVFVFNFFKRFI